MTDAPFVIAGVALAAVVIRRVLRGRRSSAASVWASAAAGAMTATAGAAGLAVGEHLHALWPLGSVARDLLSSLVVALPASIVIAGWASRHPVGPVVQLPLERRRIRATAAAVSGLLMTSMIALPVTAATTATPQGPTTSDPGDPCPADRSAAGSPFHKTFVVRAIKVQIPLNNFGDLDADGKMYVAAHDQAGLDAKLKEINDQVASFMAGGKLTPGLQDDPIQPLVMRASEGDCVDVAFTNAVGDGNPYGLHVDGLIFKTGSSGDAIGMNPASDSRVGGTHTYRFWVPENPQLEGGHYMHPGPAFRDAVNQGLFGMFIVEPPGSIALDPARTPDEIAANAQIPTREQVTGEEAMVVPCFYAPNSKLCSDYSAKHRGATPQAFRDNATIFHEIGDERYIISNRDGHKLPFVDPFTGSYRPGARAVNYRSEPFMNRLAVSQGKKETLSYDSYTFGEPAVPVTRAYVADAMKLRIMHGGTEMYHVYHLHSGGLHWDLNPAADPNFDYGDTSLLKEARSNRAQQGVVLDAQAIGPGEVFNADLNHGSGGPQHAIGDFTYHCHIAEHYISGMWGLRRVFDALQPDLWELPDSGVLAQALPDLADEFRVDPATTSLDAVDGSGQPYAYAPHAGPNSRGNLDQNGQIDNRHVFIPEGVSSVQLLQLSAADPEYRMADGSHLNPDNFDVWARTLLPPATHGFDNDTAQLNPDGTWKDGRVPRGIEDAATFDWVIDRRQTADNPDGLPLYLGELEWTTPYPNLVDSSACLSDHQKHLGAFCSDTFVQLPGEAAPRPVMTFNPSEAGESLGRLTYPFLRPHIEMRPPFAPNGHSGAPFLGEHGVQLNPVDATPLPLCAPGVASTPDSPCRALKDETSPDPSQLPNAWEGRTNAVCPFSSVHQHHVDASNPQSPFDENVDDTRHYNIVQAEVPFRVTKTDVDQAGCSSWRPTRTRSTGTTARTR